MISIIKKTLSIGVLCIVMACATTEEMAKQVSQGSRINEATEAGKQLRNIPPAKDRVAVAVYEFRDKTGQHKPNDNLAEYSRAVTQGGLEILNKALLDAGDKKWFRVLERGGINNLTQERKIIRIMRDQFASKDGDKLPPPEPLLYAGVLLEGGVIAYESNVMTGGAGARYLGIGGSTEYRRDVVTVNLRATSVQSGEILISVNTSKTIYSAAASAGVFKFVAFDKLLEMEAGFTYNEPPQLAVRQAIETAVYALIMEGTMDGLWAFADKKAAQKALDTYVARRDGKAKPEDSFKEEEAVAVSEEKAPQEKHSSLEQQPTAISRKKWHMIAGVILPPDMVVASL